MQLRRMIPMPLQLAGRPVAFWLYRNAIRLQCWYLDRTEASRSANGLPVPPAMLRFRVGETSSREVFLRVGSESANAIEAALAGVGKPVAAFDSILDFGCGCGRTLMWLAARLNGKQLHGTDIDESSIRWCKTSLPNARWAVNAPLPPTTYPDDSFDLIYAISVFTHVDEERQLSWLAELHRILKPGGILLLSVYGRHSWHILPPGDIEVLEQHGHLFKTSSKLHGILPDWYHTAFHGRDYVMRTFASGFNILRYLEAALGHQDLIVLERCCSGPSSPVC